MLGMRCLCLAVFSLVVGGHSRTTSDDVIEQYMDYPYPAYSDNERIGDEAHYILHTNCFHGVCNGVPRNDTLPRFYHYTIALDVLNTYLYKGEETFENNFRVMLPGGGTGSVVVGLGEQLNHTNAEMVYLDFSLASMKIAQRRAAMMGLSGISWYNDSIESIPQLNLGKFDLIECSGVLHHLPNPQEGLNILADSLTKNGGMSIMVYGSVGRTGVYHLQELVRMINMGVTNREEELNNVQKLLRSFDNHTLERMIDSQLNGDQRYFLNGVYNGRNENWDVEAYDRLCHKQDRAYTAKEMFEFIKNAGMHFISSNGAAEKFVLSLEHNQYFGDLDDKTRRHLKRLSEEEKIAVAELVDGSVDNHYFYASRIEDAEAAFTDPTNVPYIYGEPKNLDFALKTAVYISKTKPNQSTALMFRYQMDSPKGAWQVDWTVTQTVKRMMELIEDRNKTMGEVVDIIAREINKEKDQIYMECKKFYQDAKKTNIILLKKQNVPNFPKTYMKCLFGLNFL